MLWASTTTVRIQDLGSTYNEKPTDWLLGICGRRPFQDLLRVLTDASCPWRCRLLKIHKSKQQLKSLPTARSRHDYMITNTWMEVGHSCASPSEVLSALAA